MTDEKQLPLWSDPEIVLSWFSLEKIEQSLLNQLIYHRGGMIPPPYDTTKVAIVTLKAKGLVRDSLIATGYIEITKLGNRLADDYFETLHRTGKMWTCSH